MWSIAFIYQNKGVYKKYIHCTREKKEKIEEEESFKFLYLLNKTIY